MKKKAIIFAMLILLVIVLGNFMDFKNGKNIQAQITHEEQQKIDIINSPKWLKTEGSQLKNGAGEYVQLKGLSSHGIQWYSNLITYENLEKLKNEWNTNVFRIAMYTDPNNGGYVYDSEECTQKVYNIVDMATKLDMYVIIDWHTLKDNNPKTYQSQSEEFFNKVSEKYANNPYVIYEICNEPNGKSVTWANDVKPYAENIIKVIRKNSPKSLIVVGTPNWCTDLTTVADDPLNYDNVMYSCHFYAGSHGQNLQSQIDYCINKNIPIIISECGITDSSGNGKIYTESFENWMSYIENKKLSWIYWSFCNKGEESSVLRQDYPIKADNNETQYQAENYYYDEYGNIHTVEESNTQPASTDIDEYLTEAGNIVKNYMIQNN